MSALLIWDVVNEALLNNSSPKKRQLDRKASKLVQHLVSILHEYEHGELEMEESSEVDRVEDVEMDHNYDPSIDSDVRVLLPTDPVHPKMCRIGDQLVDINDAEKAVAYYGSFGDAKRTGKKRPSWSTVNKKFPFIKTEMDLRRLADLEKNGVEINANNAIQFVSEEMYKKVSQHLDDGHIIHDRDLRQIAMDIVAQNNLQIRFSASSSWIDAWKRAHRISSRRITKFVSRKRFVDAAEIQKKSEECVKQVKSLMTGYSNHQVYNADQSGFVFEMHTMRTLARTGVKDVPVVVRSESNMKRSYTVMPMINADGGFAPKMFVVLKEPGGKLPAKGHFPVPNLVVKAYTTHMMTKGLMLEFFQECVFDKDMPDDLLLLLDSWTSWRDMVAIDSVKPASTSLKTVTIPPGCTGRIQPLDVGVFGQFKKIIKAINAYAQRNYPNFHVAVRDNILKVSVISLVFWQMSHPSLKEWVKEAWFLPGYLNSHPLPYDTPFDLLFPMDVAGHCEIPSCQNSSFICCLYCQKHICFSHFIEDYHYTKC
ncbi:hypothetical protein CRE_21232 [Caenorhabditis remanei]|uniref:HTH CENPB-type domain-containing protein n=1 Tax=Caenorhabditis remanei TaxID=31234 RepID=E3MF01_CAERE|nr:hypothetical protein CRE_21232 [Caenorhabditis remanei]